MNWFKKIITKLNPFKNRVKEKKPTQPKIKAQVKEKKPTQPKIKAQVKVSTKTSKRPSTAVKSYGSKGNYLAKGRPSVPKKKLTVYQKYKSARASYLQKVSNKQLRWMIHKTGVKFNKDGSLNKFYNQKLNKIYVIEAAKRKVRNAKTQEKREIAMERLYNVRVKFKTTKGITIVDSYRINGTSNMDFNSYVKQFGNLRDVDEIQEAWMLMIATGKLVPLKQGADVGYIDVENSIVISPPPF